MSGMNKARKSKRDTKGEIKLVSLSKRDDVAKKDVFGLILQHFQFILATDVLGRYSALLMNA